MLSIQLLGTPLVLRDDQPLAITRKKSRALLFYLAAHDKPLTREQILAVFWPDSDRVSAQQVLRTTLHGLRQALGAALVTDESTLALSPEVSIDVIEFETMLAGRTFQPSISDLRSLIITLQLYRGDFLTGFSLSDSAEFDDWLTEQQEHYRRLAIRGFIALAALHEQQRDYQAALAALDRALAFDPLQEDVQRSALRVHYLAGDRTGAIRRYESLRQLLDEEMGVPPMAETRALYDAIISDQGIGERRSGTGVPARPTASPAAAVSHRQSLINQLPFIGREGELRKIHEAAAERQLTLIEGEPGIGKTRLAEEFLRTQPGLQLRGAAHELEHALPYQPFIEALRELLEMPGWSALQARLELPAVWWHELARLVPEVMPQIVSSAADESRLWEGVHQFLVALSRWQPIAVFIDDTQWADASTLGLLGYLVRVTTVSVNPIVFVAASRPIELRTPLGLLVQTLTREGRVLRCSLKRLSSVETAALAQQISPAFAYPLADWLMQQSEGNPYVLSELITHARDSGLLQADGTVNLSALSASPVVPPSIFSLIQARLARLSDPARRILDAAVAMGRVFEFEVVARAAALSENAALDALDELRAARLIQPQGPGGSSYAFDHSLTMEVAYREVGEPRHRLLHRRVAEAMEAIYGKQYLDGIAGVLAWHFREGGDGQRAAPYALRAARLARQIAAWREAIEFYDQALAADLPDSERASILLEAGEAHLRSGETAQAIEAYRTALKFCAPHSMEADRVRLALAQSLLNQARYAEAIDLVKEVRATGRPEMIVNAEMQWGTTLSVEGADLIGAAEHLQNAEMLLRQQSDQPDPARLAQIKFEQGSVAAQRGELERAVALYHDTIDIGAEDLSQGALPFQVLGYNNLAYHLHLLHDSTAIQYAQRGLQLAQEQGVVAMQPFLLSTLGEIELDRDVSAAERYFTEGLTLAERLSMPERIAGLTANLGRVAQQRGESELAIQRFSTALANAETLGLLHLAAQIRLWLVPLLPPDEARAALIEVRTLARRTSRKRLLEEAQQLELKLLTE